MCLKSQTAWFVRNYYQCGFDRNMTPLPKPTTAGEDGGRGGAATLRRERSPPFFCSPWREKMTSLLTNLEACTDEELESKLARVLAYASGETLNDAEVQEFHQLYEEILRRALAVTAA